MAELLLEKTPRFIHKNSDKSIVKKELSKQRDLFQAYSALGTRLQDALELTDFEDLLPELEHEAKDIEALLEAMNLLATMTDELDWAGAFITIRGSTIISGRSWLERNPEKDFEDSVIQSIANHLEANFRCSRVYNAYHSHYPYDPHSEYQPEITIYLNDFYAYDKLKDEAGYHSIIKANKRMEIFIEILPVLAPPSVIQETELFPFTVYGAASPYISQSLSGACLIHLPTRIQARSSEAAALLFNREIASMLLQSRLQESGEKNEKPHYTYSWDNQQLTDHTKRDTYPFSQAHGFSNAIIKDLEKPTKFQEK